MGEGGAYRMLLFAGDRPVLPVDARVSRVARRLGYGSAESTFTRTVRSVRESLEGELPQTVASYRRAFLYLSHHGAATCAEANPHCQVCPRQGHVPGGRQEIDDCGLTIADCLVQRRDALAQRLDVLPDLRVLLAVGFVERR